MKKVLFGIMALSMAAFAQNPGGPTTDGLGNETASVPVKITATVENAPVGLTITDESGVALQELLLEHGKLAIGNVVEDSVASKEFRVRRYDATGNMVVLAPAGADPKLTISLDQLTTTLLKGGTDATSDLKSNLSLNGTTGNEYVVDLNTDDQKEHIGKITSVIPKTEFAVGEVLSGFHHNSAERTLTVVYTPN